MPATDATESPLEAALRYAGVGWRVFPLHWVNEGHCSCGGNCDGNAGKHPLTRHGVLDASADAKQINEWWSRWPHANIGVATGGGLFVLDVDPKNGGSSAGLELPDTPRVITQSGGEHWYYVVQDDVPGSVGRVGEGLDVRCAGGYVVAPPSVGLGGAYSWDVGSPEDFVAAPRWLIDRSAKPRAVGEAPKAADAYVSGGRNSALTSLAGTMVRRGMCLSAVESALLAENAHKCHPPLEEREVVAIARSVGRYDASAPITQDAADRGPWKLVSASALAAPLPPVQWVCEALRIAPGPPTLVAGYGYSAKTLSLQALALAVAAGVLVWGIHSAQTGDVVHIDYEQGLRLTQERYQRLALGMGVDLAEVGDRLQVACLPDVYLDAEGAMAQLVELVRGKRLAIIDSYRAAFPRLDENSSEARRWLDMLTRVSEETGCAIVVIHHARKAQKDAVGGSAQSIRGSGAIFDACQSVFVFGGKKGEPVRVEHVKERLGGRSLDDFWLSVEDVEGVSLDPEDDGRIIESAGVRVRVGTAPVESMAELAADYERLDAAIIDAVSAAMRAGQRMTVRDLARVVRARTADISGPDGRVSYLESCGVLRACREGKYRWLELVSTPGQVVGS